MHLPHQLSFFYFLFALMILAVLPSNHNMIMLVESKWLSCFECPKSDDYSPECLDAITPPWPICLRHSSEEWVNIAIDSVPRCCGDDLSECKCPMKDSTYFLNRIDDYCDGIDACNDDRKKKALLATQEAEVTSDK